ncbi:hypothetical protein QCM8_177 [Bacillus phage QCM8]|nr:hypothetical protein QCM8_177 [Bacillus phage QCM8]
MVISRLGEAEANTLLCNIFISGKMHPEKQLKFYHFRKKS